jgi:predicted esterase YcpF (UPF0227 family)
MNTGSGDGKIVVIFHGYTSSCQNQRYLHLPLQTAGIDIDHDRTDWQQIHDMYSALLAETFQKADRENVILLGHSLGGWWARYFADKLRLRAVLLNPLVDILATNTKIPDRDRYLCCQPEIGRFAGSGLLTYYIELPDEVIDYEKTIDLLQRDGRVIIKNGGHHRIRWPENIAEILLDVAAEKP